jgi:hypothetical protein
MDYSAMTADGRIISTGQGFQPGPVEDAGERQLAACGTSFLRLVFRSTESFGWTIGV